MDAATLARAMGCSQDVANRYVADMNAAMIQAGCTTVNRAAMWCAQIGHESAGLRYLEEIASGQAYEGRKDLGNTQAGDGKRFKGRGPIQLTGRHNYGLFGQWCQRQGLVTDAGYFLTSPAVVATSRWGFLAAAWYWTAARPKLNEQADAADITAATRSINGGTNGIADRRARWERCRALGQAILPGGSAPAAPAASSVELDEGDTGAAVAALQAFLNVTFPSYSKLDLTPQRYGPATVAVIAEFQRRSGIAGDGKNVGPKTLAALRAAGFRG